ncbi:uncharacterized protein K460DRAFT_401948 [Cucurbitaria berberidis CBS 394.84]|uniref:Uncharacterized protein n=1 Tax=Cucurbitaria berberidis CBS 394.84 TaxID=1168544 RepID=A0A9P4GVB4_9PLEO|nr:uncharacterized protein K460DRAFT_401948 [Cucurbitaria berberidis CBS 394.84]KAF1851949.1 hypothetical protein K460DRAFT_401948 [Cucurbitaria berberidis CBS 394.84]
MDPSSEGPLPLIDNMHNDNDNTKRQESDCSSQGQSNPIEAFPGYTDTNTTIEEQVHQGQRRCPKCHAPNARDGDASTVECFCCRNEFAWDKAEEVQTPCQSPGAASIRETMTEHISLDSPSEKTYPAEPSHAEEQNLNLAKPGNEGQIGLGTTIDRELASEAQKRTEKRTCSTTTGQPANQPSASRSYSGRRHRSKLSISGFDPSASPIELSNRSADVHASQPANSSSNNPVVTPLAPQPMRHSQMTMSPPIELSATCSPVSWSSGAHVSEAAKYPTHARGLESENRTAWQRMKSRCQSIVCCGVVG